MPVCMCERTVFVSFLYFSKALKDKSHSELLVKQFVNCVLLCKYYICEIIWYFRLLFQANDVAKQIVVKRDLGCKASSDPIVIGQETKYSLKLAKDFWSVIGEKKVPKVQGNKMILM